MESGYGTTGDCYEQCREEITLGTGCINNRESVECVQLHRRMCNEYTDNCTDDHAEEHECCHIITRLHKKPHWHNRCKEQVSHDDVDPCILCCVDRKFHTDCKHNNEKCDGNYGTDNFVHLADFLLDQTEDNCDYDKKHRDGSCC